MRSIDIARLAGVSRSTVSRVINNYPNAPEETRRKVEEVIKQYGYTPNNSARNLVGKASKILGVFVIDFSIKGGNLTIHSSPFFSEFITCAIDKVQPLGYNILVSVINKKNKFREVEVLFSNKTISGAIFMGDQIEEGELEKLTEHGYKIALINQKKQTNNNCVILINTGNVQGGYLAAQKLIEKGHKRIGHITGDIQKLSVEERLEGFKQKLQEVGMSIKPEYISFGSLHREEGGYNAMKRILEDNKANLPTAIFAANDLMAIGALRAIKEFGLKVPEDISIIGFDNMEISKYSEPKLSTVSTSVEEIANITVSKLIELVEKNEVDNNVVCLSEAKVIDRESVCTVIS